MLKGFIFTGKAMRFCESLCLSQIWHNNGNKEVLERVAIDKDLLDDGALSIDVLKLLWSDVLTLREFEDILCSINDLYSTIR